MKKISQLLHVGNEAVGPVIQSLELRRVPWTRNRDLQTNRVHVGGHWSRSGAVIPARGGEGLGSGGGGEGQGRAELGWQVGGIEDKQHTPINVSCHLSGSNNA